MRAGKLDRTITLDAYTEGAPDDYGTSMPGWTPFATIRAEIITMSAVEFLRAYGESSEQAIVFRVRFLEGVTTGHRVGFQGRQYDVKEVKEIGRRKGLELRCEEARQ